MGGLFDIPKLEEEKEALKKQVNSDGFWNDLNHANTTYQHLKSLEKTINDYHDLLIEVELLTEMSETEDISNEIPSLQDRVWNLEIKNTLNGEYDNSNCYLEIHPGAGGTESCDWASMLSRMYERFFEKMGYTYKIIDKLDGDEAGIKSITYYVNGSFAYGYLKCEKGVHRLVRISPFDANKRRHTSFASVSVTPEFKEDINIDIKDDDLKIDVYHSSGAGGQSVNTSNSAVRITHLPTKTVVTCQTERSQLRNKEIALNMLKNKLYEKKLEEQSDKLKDISGNIVDNSFGNQIRSYILEPYKLVKDNRSKFESTDPYKILDGDIKELIESVLKVQKI